MQTSSRDLGGSFHGFLPQLAPHVKVFAELNQVKMVWSAASNFIVGEHPSWQTGGKVDKEHRTNADNGWVAVLRRDADAEFEAQEALTECQISSEANGFLGVCSPAGPSGAVEQLIIEKPSQ